MTRSLFLYVFLICLAFFVAGCASDSSSSNNDVNTPPVDNSTDPVDNSTDPGDNSTDPGDNSTDPVDNSTNPGNTLNSTFVDIRQINIPAVSFQSLTNPDDFKTRAEYQKNAGVFDAINVTAAWAAGATGAGVTIAVADAGIYNGAEFQGKTIVQLSNITVGNTTYLYDHDYFYENSSHGTIVAGVLAANFDDLRNSDANVTDVSDLKQNGVTGIAYGADLISVPVLYYECLIYHCPILGGDVQSPTNSEVSELNALISEAMTQTLALRPEFMNLSFGTTLTYQELIDLGHTNATLTDSFAHYITPFSQTATQDDEKTVFVLAAGNFYENYAQADTNYGVDPSVFATMPEFDSSLENLTITVVASVSGTNQTIADYSNRCGITADYCIMAPGTHTVYAALYEQYNTTADEEIVLNSGVIKTGYGTASGTSFAAPLVTGALAVVYDYFNGTISPLETRTRILETADNSTCLPAICGRGFLDVGAAILPVGDTNIVLGNSIYDHNLIKLESGLGIDIASGSAWQPSGLANGQVITLDQLNSPFATNVADLVSFSQNNHIQARDLYIQQSFATDLEGFTSAGYAFDGVGSAFHLTSHFTNDISTSFSIANDRNLIQLTEVDGTTNTVNNLALESAAIAQYSDSSKADYLSFSVANKHHNFTSGMCFNDAQCEMLAYNFNAKNKSLSLGLANQERLSSSDQVNNFGISYDQAFSNNQLNIAIEEISINAGWDMTAALNIGFGSQRVEYSSNSPSQSVFDGSAFVLLQDTLALNMQLSSASRLHISYLDQSDSTGSTAMYLPVGRIADGSISYDSFAVDFDTHMQSRTSLGYSLHQSDSSGNLQLYLQLNHDNYLDGSDNQLAMQFQLYL